NPHRAASRRWSVSPSPFLIAVRPPTREAVIAVIETIAQQLCAGQHVAIHSYMGIGRAAMIVACALIVLGYRPDQALRLVTTARGCLVSGIKQPCAWVLALPSVIRL